MARCGLTVLLTQSQPVQVLAGFYGFHAGMLQGNQMQVKLNFNGLHRIRPGFSPPGSPCFWLA
jgi:hypothetical protein